jgi:hypothetical protein
MKGTVYEYLMSVRKRREGTARLKRCLEILSRHKYKEGNVWRLLLARAIHFSWRGEEKLDIREANLS